MKATIQINLETLKSIILNAENARQINDSLSRTVIIDQLKETDSHTGEDDVIVYQVNSYQDCDASPIFSTEKPKTIHLNYNNYVLQLSWKSDLKVTVRYYDSTTDIEIQDWNQIDRVSQKIITQIVDTYCEEQGLTKWTY